MSDKKHHEEPNKELGKELEENLAKMAEENEKLKEQLLRLAAESDNFRKRSAKQVEDAGKFAVNNFARDLIEVLENLYLASSNIPLEALEENELLKSVSLGVEMTKTTLINVFNKHGIQRIYPNIGDAFNPDIMEAVANVEEEGCAENTIVNIMRAGYLLHDRLIKPAMVVVAKASK